MCVELFSVFIIVIIPIDRTVWSIDTVSCANIEIFNIKGDLDLDGIGCIGSFEMQRKNSVLLNMFIASVVFINDLDVFTSPCPHRLWVGFPNQIASEVMGSCCGWTRDSDFEVLGILPRGAMTGSIDSCDCCGASIGINWTCYVVCVNVPICGSELHITEEGEATAEQYIANTVHVPVMSLSSHNKGICYIGGYRCSLNS